MSANVRKSLLVFVATCGLAGMAHAVPVRYSFTSGNPVQASGVAIGQFAPGETANGSFMYDADSPVFGTTPFPLGTGNVYASITDWEGFVGGRRFFDGLAGTVVGNDIAGTGVDYFALTGTEPGTSWEPFSIAGEELVRAQIIWLEGTPAGTPDFLDSNNQPSVIPSFTGFLRLDFGGEWNNSRGFVIFGNVIARPVGVPEPGALMLMVGGLVFGAFLIKRRSIH